MGGRREGFNFKDSPRKDWLGQNNRHPENSIVPKGDRKLLQGSTLFQLFLIQGQKNYIQRTISENKGSGNNLW